MRTTKQTIACPGNDPSGCDSAISIEFAGTHDLRSTSTTLDDLAVDAGWKDGKCPLHRHGRPDSFKRVPR